MGMIERVARAIEMARTAGTQDWRRVNSTTLARAAIEAMREPTEAMVESVVIYGDAYTRETWPAMIDAALAEDGK